MCPLLAHNRLRGRESGRDACEVSTVVNVARAAVGYITDILRDISSASLTFTDQTPFVPFFV